MPLMITVIACRVLVHISTSGITCSPPHSRRPSAAKYGMDTANPVNKTWLPTLSGFYRRHGDGCAFLASLALDAETAISYGGMRQIWLTLELDPDASTPLPTVALALAWKNKTASRMAESSWLSFQLDVHTAGTSEGPGGDPSKWAMDVLGYPVNPVDVVPMGTRHIHAVWVSTKMFHERSAESEPQPNITTHPRRMACATTRSRRVGPLRR